MDVGLVFQAVCAEERVSNLQSEVFRHAGPGGDLVRGVPQLAFRQRRVVVLDVAVLGAHDAVPFVVVPVSQRDARVDVGVLEDLLRRALVDVARGRIDVVDVGQNELKGASFRAQDEVDVFDVAFERVVHLLLRQKHEAHHAHPKAEQGQTQGRLQGLGPKVSPRLIGQVQLHALVGFRVTQWG